MRSHAISPSPTFANLRQPSALFDSLPFPRGHSQVPEGLPDILAPEFHYVDVAAGLTRFLSRVAIRSLEDAPDHPRMVTHGWSRCCACM